MFKADILRPAMSEVTTLIVFAPYNDGSLQFYVHFRRLNDINEEESYAPPPSVPAHQVLQRSAHLLSFTCKLRLLEYLIRWRGLLKDPLYQLTRPVPIFTESVWTDKCAHNLSKYNGQCCLPCEVAGGSHIRRRYSHLLENSRTTL